MNRGPARFAHRMHFRGGSAVVEYVVVTALALGALLFPLGNDDRSVLRRLIEAIQQDHAGYLYAASVPVLPRGDSPGSSIPPGSGGSVGGGSGGGESPPTGSGGNGNPGGSGPGTGPGGDSGGGLGGLIDDVVGGIGLGGGGGTGLLDPRPGNNLVGGDDPGAPADPDTDGPDLGGGACPAPDTAPSDDGFFGAAQPTQVAATHVGNPIHVVTGNKYQRETDVVLPGLRLAFIRHYNSRSRMTGSLGAGWRHAYETRLQDSGDQVRLWQADGRRIDFIAEPAGRLPPGVRRYRAVQHGDGSLSAGAYGYQWRWRDGTQLDFGRDTQLRSITDPDGQRLRLNHDGRGRLVGITNPQGQSLRLAYGPQGRIESITDPAGAETRYRYDSDQRLIEVTYADDTIRRYHYEDPNDRHNLTGISAGHEAQPLTRIRTWAYDEADRAIRSEHEAGSHRVSLAFGDGQTRVTDEWEQQSVYRTDRVQGVPIIKAIDGPGCSPCSSQGDLEYRYDAGLQLVGIEHRGGSGLSYEYDDRGRLRAASFRTAGGDWTQVAGFEYEGATTRIAQMRIPSIRPDHWRRIEVEYDARGWPSRASEHGFAPSSGGQYRAISRTQHFSCDGAGRLAEIDGPQDSGDDLTRLEWLDAGASRTVFPDGGFIAVLARDAAGRASRIQTDAGEALDLDYDATGKIVSARRGAQSIGFQYDDAGGLIALSRGGASDASWQGLRPPRRPPLSPSDAWRWAQDLSPAAVQARQTVALKDPGGRITRYSYDDFGRRVRIDSPDSGTRHFEYSGSNQVIRTQDANGHEARFEYDGGGKLVRTQIGQDPIRYRWQGQGTSRRLQATGSPAADERFEYDPAGRIVEREVRIGEHRHVTAYRYDKAGRLIGKTLPDGRSLVFRYDAQGGLGSIAERRLLQDDHQLIGNLRTPESTGSRHTQSWQSFNGITTTLTRSADRLVGLRIGHLHDFTYRYGAQGAAAGKIIGIDDAGAVDQRYRFDAQGRLDFALTPQALFGYRYDANGNRTRTIINGQVLDAQTDRGSNRLHALSLGPPSWQAPLRAGFAAWIPELPIRSSSSSLGFQPGGEITRFGDLSIRYNSNGQPDQVSRGDTVLAQYRYNARAERIEKITFGRDAATTRYLWEDGRVQAEIAAEGTITRQYVYLGHHPVAILEAGQTYAVHTNHLGAPIAVTNLHRQQIWQARYAPFGEALVDEDPDGDGHAFTLNLRLPGQYEDPETGFYYNHHRYYDPSTGRYLSPDPLGLTDGPNPYVYVANDPVNFIDPNGLLLFAFDGTGNNDPAQGEKDLSNVVKFRDSYSDPIMEGCSDEGGESCPEPGVLIGSERSPSDQHYFYISGPGTRDERSGIQYPGPLGHDRDSANGYTMPVRIASMADDFFDYIAWMQNQDRYRQRDFTNATLNIDVVGFSRGAAEARVFINLLIAFLKGDSNFDIDRSADSRYRYDFTSGDPNYARDYIEEVCLAVNLRFLGLFDTVPHYKYGSQDNDLIELDLAIPSLDASVTVKNVAHAVAVNENRENFDAISIHRHRTVGNTSSRLELGFIGAHADIGGGYSEGDLSDVAFMWMVQRAKDAGIAIDDGLLGDEGWSIVTAPVVHKSQVACSGAVSFICFSQGEGREFRWLNDSHRTFQHEWNGYGMDWATSQQGLYDKRYTRTQTTVMRDGATWTRETYGEDYEGNETLVGVAAPAYGQWLKEHYGLEILMNESGLEGGVPPRIQPEVQ